jgi:tellurite resistance protein TerC
VIFQGLAVPERSHHKVLFYGVAGALVLRGAFIYAGVQMLQEFHAALYVFGLILLFTGGRMLYPGTRSIQPEKNWLVRLTKKILPIAESAPGSQFFVKRQGKRYATHLFLALMAVEAMDIIFAVDSVPAVLAITRDTFIVYSSNVFAILGLRALYFALASVLPRFRFLHQGLAAILIFVGAKMLAREWIQVSTFLSLCVLAGILAITIAASLLFPARGSRPRTGD